MSNVTTPGLAIISFFASRGLSKHYTLLFSTIDNLKKIDIKIILQMNPKNYDGTSRR